MISEPKNIPITDYDYDLPPERIAQYPLDRRDHSKLLIHRDGETSDDHFFNLAKHLPSGSTLVFNETRVIHARLLFRKEAGSQVEIFCLEPAGSIRDQQLAFEARGSSEWTCLVGNSRRWKQGALSLSLREADHEILLKAERIQQSQINSVVRFSWHPESYTFAEILEKLGKMPLPPYISRPAGLLDDDHYQTVYARQDGSVAAPTAGLHFTPELLQDLRSQGHQLLQFILHVGAGTFRPVNSKIIGDHEMHQEHVRYELDSLKALHKSLDGPLALVGTTTTRLMESLYWHGVKLIKGKAVDNWLDIGQWDAYQFGFSGEITRKQSLEAVIESLEKNGETLLTGETRMMIAPGYHFAFPDMLITNFHQPKSTLLLLIAAFIGQDWTKAYQYALDHDFRFLSYGDSCLFYRQ